jgi:hypothetical protein
MPPSKNEPNQRRNKMGILDKDFQKQSQAWRPLSCGVRWGIRKPTNLYRH